MGLPQPVATACQEIAEDRRLDGHQLARRALVAMVELFETADFASYEELLDESRASAVCLARVRPSACVVANAMAELYVRISRIGARSDDPRSAAQQAASTYLGELERTFLEISRQVGRIMGPEKVVLATSCTEPLVEGICRGRAARVVVAESRPSYEGRAAAVRLAEAGIPVELVSDAAAPSLVRDVTEVIVGASVVLADGAAVGRVGSYGVALAAAEAKVPVHVVAEHLRIAPLHATPQERRPDHELWEDAPRGVEVVNLAFDLIPTALTTSIVTERGQTTADEAAQIAAQKRKTWRALGLA